VAVSTGLLVLHSRRWLHWRAPWAGLLLLGPGLVRCDRKRGDTLCWWRDCPRSADRRTPQMTGVTC